MMKNWEIVSVTMAFAAVVVVFASQWPGGI